MFVFLGQAMQANFVKRMATTLNAMSYLVEGSAFFIIQKIYIYSIQVKLKSVFPLMVIKFFRKFPFSQFYEKV